MKNRKFLSAVLLMLLIASVCVMTVFAAAEAKATPTLTLVGASLELENAVYMNFKAAAANIADTSSVKLLLWEAPPETYTKDTADVALPLLKVESGTDYLVYRYDDLAAKEMTKFVYVRAYANVDGVDVYSNITRFSIVQYASIIANGNYDAGIKTLMENMLVYGASAQTYFNHNTDFLATDAVYRIKVQGGTHADGLATNYYKAGTNINATANAPAEGYEFSHWENAAGENVSTEQTLSIPANVGETYTAKYKEKPKYSENLEYESNGDGTCYVIGRGTCEDTAIVIPPTSPEDDTVMGIDSKAFQNDTAIVSVSFPSTIEEIGSRAFNGCTALTDVYFDGTAEEWDDVIVSGYNDPITNATKHFTAVTYTVTFKDHDGAVLKTQSVTKGGSATPPADPTRENYIFSGWSGSYTNVTADQIVTATYTAIPTGETYTVTFYDEDGETELGTSVVAKGGVAVLPQNPTKTGAAFVGWSGNYVNVTKNERVTAVYDDAVNVIGLDTKSGAVGETVTMTLAFKGDVNFCAYNICVKYDAAVLELTEVKKALSYCTPEVVSSVGNVSLGYASAGNIEDISEDMGNDGSVITLTFRILDTTVSAGALSLEVESMTYYPEDTANPGSYLSTQSAAEYTVINGAVLITQ